MPPGPAGSRSSARRRSSASPARSRRLASRVRMDRASLTRRPPSARRRSSRCRAPPRVAVGGNSPTISPSYMTRMRSESERTSSSSSETSRTARPSSRSSTSRRCTNSIAPTSSPRVGCAAIRTLGSRSISRARIDLLLVAAGERARRASAGLPPRTSNSCDQPSRALDEHGSGRASRSASRRLAVVVQRDVLGEREVEHEAAALAVLRDVAEPGLEVISARSRCVTSSPPTTTRPASGRAQAGERLDQLGLAVAVDAGDADDLAARARRSETPRTFSRPRSSRTCRSSTSRSGSPASAGPFSTRSSTSRPTISRARPSSVAPCGGSVSIDLAAPEHGDPVGDLEHLVQLVADEDDRHALARAALAGSRRARPPPAASAPPSARRG